MWSAYIRRAYWLAPCAQCVVWFGFLGMQGFFSRAEKSLTAMRTAVLPARVLQLEITSPDAAAGARGYEVGLTVANQPAVSYLVSAAAAQPTKDAAGRGQQAAVTLRGALGQVEHGAAAALPLQIQIAARDASGCIAYGGERRLIVPAARSRSHSPRSVSSSEALVVRVILQRLPQAICI